MSKRKLTKAEKYDIIKSLLDIADEIKKNNYIEPGMISMRYSKLTENLNIHVIVRENET
jgi:hypothetical protein